MTSHPEFFPHIPPSVFYEAFCLGTRLPSMNKACTIIHQPVRKRKPYREGSWQNVAKRNLWIASETLYGPSITPFATHLAVNEHIATSTQNQAPGALLFPYREVLHKETERPIEALQANKSSSSAQMQTAPLSSPRPVPVGEKCGAASWVLP
jgi:hypothetical protein